MENDIIDDESSLGEMIRGAREVKGLSIRSFAKLANADHTLVSRIEAGKVQRPSVDLLERFAAVLEIDPSGLLAKVGIKPRLPEPRMYFRSAFGVSDDEARDMLETLRAKYGKKIGQDNTESEHESNEAT
jgi:transcriptional regulator with XRE-family HTH domain